MRSIFILLALSGLLLAWGCKEDEQSPVHSCDLRSQPNAPYCQEFNGLAADGVVSSYQSVCPAGATWSEKPCPREGAVGGCKEPPGEGFTFTLTNWFYDTANGDQATCESSGATWVTP